MVSPKKKNIAMVCGTVLAIFVASAVYISHGKQEKKNVYLTTSSSGGLRFSRALQEVVPPSWLGMEKEEDEMKSDDDHHQEDDPALHKSLRNLGRWKQDKKKMREEKKKAKDTTEAVVVVVQSEAVESTVAEAEALVEPSTTVEANTEEVSLIFNLCVESVTYFFFYTNIPPFCVLKTYDRSNHGAKPRNKKKMILLSATLPPLHPLHHFVYVVNAMILVESVAAAVPVILRLLVRGLLVELNLNR